MSSDDPGRGLKLWRHGVGAAYPLAEARDSEQVVANRTS